MRCPDGVPPEPASDADHDLDFVVNATGVQTYFCAATETGLAWTFVALEADLLPDAVLVAPLTAAGAAC